MPDVGDLKSIEQKHN